MTAARTIAILTIARTKIADPRNWGQGIRPNRINSQSCCASEAIAIEASAVPADRRAAYDALSRAIGTPRIVDWSDAPERTHAEVVDAFTKAIASLQRRAPA